MLLFLDISGGELLVILAAVFLVFGPKKVPEIARMIGKGMNELKKATSDITREFQEGVNQAESGIKNVKDTVEVSNQRLNSEYISGPEELPGDETRVPDSDTSPEENSQNSPSQRSEMPGQHNANL